MSRNVAIGLGLMEFPFSGISGFWRWVDLCEAGGVDSLWQTDRMVSREPILECMSVMAALAGRTRRLKFGVNVLSLAFRDPVLLAKQCATIDVLSEGRLLPAFGIGSPLATEWRTLNLDTKTRGRKTDEGLELDPPAVVRGRGRFRGGPLSISPAPRSAQSRCSPTCRCGSAVRPKRRSVRHRALRHRLAGRGPRCLRISVRSSPRSATPPSPPAARSTTTITAPGIPLRFGRADDPGLGRLFDAYRRRTGRDPLVHFAIGDAEAIVERIAAFAAAGISKFILRPAARGDDEMLAQTRRLVEEVLPLVAARWPRARRRAAPALAVRGAA